MTLDDALREARRRLAAAGAETPGLDARVLAREAFALSATDLLARGDAEADPAALSVFETLVARRAAGEPVGRILGRREFRGLDLALSPDSLEPRPDTECLVEVALEAVRSGSVPGAAADGTGLRFADLGTGTGAVAVALLEALPGATGIATDVAKGALRTARDNAARHGVADRLALAAGDWLAPLTGRYGMIVSNPPYVRSADVDGLSAEVRLHDPRRALDGGADGLDAYRAIAAGLAGRLLPGGFVALEIGSDQAADVAALLEAGGLEAVRVHRDLAGRDRVVAARRR